MRTIVLDCSAALALVLPDESSDKVQHTLLGYASPHTRVLVPSLVDTVHLLHLATQLTLSAYDAAYLALAEISGGVLLSLDRRLREAAQSIDVKTE